MITQSGPERTFFWTGAGISADAPSALPLGDSLTEVIVSRVCSLGAWSTVKEDFQLASMRGSSGRTKDAPRLEWVTEHLCRVVGDVALQGFGAFVNAPTNDLHEFFAEHLLSGGRHVTLNFDRCIESALGTRRPSSTPLHLHGALARDGLGDMRTRTLELTSGVRPEDEDAILDALRTSNHLVVLGYSGRDYFDIDPFFRRLAMAGTLSLRHLNVLWLEHHPETGDPMQLDWPRLPVADGRPILVALDEMGASVTYARGSTRSLLSHLAAAWGLPAPAAVAPASTATQAEALRRAGSRIVVSRTDRIRATAVFWFSMGAGNHMIELDRELAASSESSDRELREELVDLRRAGLQSVGLYKQAMLLARRLNDPIERHSALEGAYRLRGSYLRTLAHILRALSLCARPASPDREYAGHCGDLRQAYIAWYRVVRTSRGGWLISTARRWLNVVSCALGIESMMRLDPVHVFEQFRDCVPYLLAHPHGVEQIAKAWHEVPEFRAAGPLPDAVLNRWVAGGAVYVETDHFLGYLNNERTRLAEKVIAAKRNGARDKAPSQSKLTEHRRQARRQGDLPGELKAALLERVAGYPATPFPQTAFRKVEWNRTTKALWLLRWWRRTWYRRVAYPDIRG